MMVADNSTYSCKALSEAALLLHCWYCCTAGTARTAAALLLHFCTAGTATGTAAALLAEIYSVPVLFQASASCSCSCAAPDNQFCFYAFYILWFTDLDLV